MIRGTVVALFAVFPSLSNAQTHLIGAFHGMCLADGNTFDAISDGALKFGYTPIPDDLISQMPIGPEFIETKGWIIPPSEIEGYRAYLSISRSKDTELCSLHLFDTWGRVMTTILEVELEISPIETLSESGSTMVRYAWHGETVQRDVFVIYDQEMGTILEAVTPFER